MQTKSSPNKTYKTSEVASIIGIHPNTVRLYEELKLIPKPERLPNGYRVFTDLHIAQCRLIRTAFRVEVLQNGLRKKIVGVLKLSAAGDFDAALTLTEEYKKQLQQEQINAENAIIIVKQLLSDAAAANTQRLTCKEASAALGVSVDSLRNWEKNGLLSIKRKENGYRIYTNEDVRRLKVIRALRCANYSLEAILRLLRQLSENPDADVRATLNTPQPSDDIISVCDRLIASLSAAQKNACLVSDMLHKMKNTFA